MRDLASLLDLNAPDGGSDRRAGGWITPNCHDLHPCVDDESATALDAARANQRERDAPHIAAWQAARARSLARFVRAGRDTLYIPEDAK